MKATILNIQNTEGLKSDAWDSLKSQMEIGHQNGINDLIAANNSVIADSNTLIGAVGDKDLDEDEIRSKIEHLESLNNMYKSQKTNLLNQSKTNPAIASMNSTALNILDNAISKNGTEIAKYKADLREIRRIEGATESLYQNSEGLYDNVRAGIAVLNNSRSSGFSLSMNQTEWKSAVQKEKDILTLRKKGFTDEHFEHMKEMNTTPSEVLQQWNTLKTKEDKEFFLLMYSGKEENYKKAFKIDPNNLSDATTMTMACYARKLAQYELRLEEKYGIDSKVFENFNNAMMKSERDYEYIDA
ncbi:hypothetical protein [Miniphocaeibacter massiliensis]|uniref:hypothetical protein n=1 Tax=Miniphocaeibacter massiliensis TaxID=2041841 RepID=UPI000C1C6BB2|nr:hypothetical protein [Miniphocaeibacter massiliensis]